MIYYYPGDTATYHPDLGTLEPGENEIPDELKDVAEALVASGVLQREGYVPPDEPNVVQQELIEDTPQHEEAHDEEHNGENDQEGTPA